ncbi:uncharacterized protein METZ01_LOCUS481328, partial [marine metagenome]
RRCLPGGPATDRGNGGHRILRRRGQVHDNANVALGPRGQRAHRHRADTRPRM